MRKPNFEGWVSRELRYLSGENTLNLRRLAFLAQGPVPRLKERLVLYAVVTGKHDRLREYLYDERYLAELDEIKNKLTGIDLTTADPNDIVGLPDRYLKALSSYQAAYSTIKTRNASKRMRWEKTISLQKRKGVSNADIYRHLGLDAGNVNAYLKHGDLGRVTLSTATDIMNYLITMP